MNLKMGHVGSKNRSLAQILEKRVRSRSHIFSQMILMKLGQNDRLNEIFDKFETGSYQVKKLGQILEKPCVCCKGFIFSPVLAKLR